LQGEACDALRRVQREAGWCLAQFGEQTAGDDLHSRRRNEVEEAGVGLGGQAGKFSAQDGMSLERADLTQADTERAVDERFDLVGDDRRPGQRAGKRRQPVTGRPDVQRRPGKLAEAVTSGRWLRLARQVGQLGHQPGPLGGAQGWVRPTGAPVSLGLDALALRPVR
jgi:hypothetical protein